MYTLLQQPEDSHYPT